VYKHFILHLPVLNFVVDETGKMAKPFLPSQEFKWRIWMPQKAEDLEKSSPPALWGILG